MQLQILVIKDGLAIHKWNPCGERRDVVSTGLQGLQNFSSITRQKNLDHYESCMLSTLRALCELDIFRFDPETYSAYNERFWDTRRKLVISNTKSSSLFSTLLWIFDRSSRRFGWRTVILVSEWIRFRWTYFQNDPIGLYFLTFELHSERNSTHKTAIRTVPRIR